MRKVRVARNRPPCPRGTFRLVESNAVLIRQRVAPRGPVVILRGDGSAFLSVLICFLPARAPCGCALVRPNVYDRPDARPTARVKPAPDVLRIAATWHGPRAPLRPSSPSARLRLGGNCSFTSFRFSRYVLAKCARRGGAGCDCGLLKLKSWFGHLGNLATHTVTVSALCRALWC